MTQPCPLHMVFHSFSQIQPARNYPVPLNFLSKEHLYAVISLPGEILNPLTHSSHKVLPLLLRAFNILTQTVTFVKHSKLWKDKRFDGVFINLLERRRWWCQWEGIHLLLLWKGLDPWQKERPLGGERLDVFMKLGPIAIKQLLQCQWLCYRLSNWHRP